MSEVQSVGVEGNMKIQKLRDAAQGCTCVRCGGHDAMLCHYTGKRQHDYGKGTATKGHDAIGAHLCNDCHTYFDQYKSANDYERSEEFLHCIALTIMRLFRMGKVK